MKNEIQSNAKALVAAISIIGLVLSFACESSVQGARPEEDAYVSSDKENEFECNWEEGTHSASVDYYNPDTGHSATYTLDVDVQDCQIVQITFPNGGYLDDTHIDPTQIDDNGHATIEDDRGRSFEVQIDE